MAETFQTSAFSWGQAYGVAPPPPPPPPAPAPAQKAVATVQYSAPIGPSPPAPSAPAPTVSVSAPSAPAPVPAQPTVEAKVSEALSSTYRWAKPEEALAAGYDPNTKMWIHVYADKPYTVTGVGNVIPTFTVEKVEQPSYVGNVPSSAPVYQTGGGVAVSLPEQIAVPIKSETGEVIYTVTQQLKPSESQALIAGGEAGEQLKTQLEASAMQVYQGGAQLQTQALAGVTQPAWISGYKLGSRDFIEQMTIAQERKMAEARGEVFQGVKFTYIEQRPDLQSPRPSLFEEQYVYPLIMPSFRVLPFTAPLIWSGVESISKLTGIEKPVVIKEIIMEGAPAAAISFITWPFLGPVIGLLPKTAQLLLAGGIIGLQLPEIAKEPVKSLSQLAGFTVGGIAGAKFFAPALTAVETVFEARAGKVVKDITPKISEYVDVYMKEPPRIGRVILPEVSPRGIRIGGIKTISRLQEIPVMELEEVKPGVSVVQPGKLTSIGGIRAALPGAPIPKSVTLSTLEVLEQTKTNLQQVARSTGMITFGEVTGGVSGKVTGLAEDITFNIGGYRAVTGEVGISIAQYKSLYGLRVPTTLRIELPSFGVRLPPSLAGLGYTPEEIAAGGISKPPLLFVSPKKIPIELKLYQPKMTSISTEIEAGTKAYSDMLIVFQEGGGYAWTIPRGGTVLSKFRMGERPYDIFSTVIGEESYQIVGPSARIGSLTRISPPKEQFLVQFGEVGGVKITGAGKITGIEPITTFKEEIGKMPPAKITKTPLAKTFAFSIEESITKSIDNLEKSEMLMIQKQLGSQIRGVPAVSPATATIAKALKSMGTEVKPPLVMFAGEVIQYPISKIYKLPAQYVPTGERIGGLSKVLPGYKTDLFQIERVAPAQAIKPPTIGTMLGLEATAISLKITTPMSKIIPSVGYNIFQPEKITYIERITEIEIQKIINIQRITAEIGHPVPAVGKIPIPEPTTLPFMFPLPFLPKGLKEKSVKGKKKKAKERREYRPSLIAEMYGIKGIKPIRISGIEVRPMLQSSRRRGKKR